MDKIDRTKIYIRDGFTPVVTLSKEGNYSESIKHGFLHALDQDNKRMVINVENILFMVPYEN